MAVTYPEKYSNQLSALSSWSTCFFCFFKIYSPFVFQGGSATFPVRVAGTPLVIGCPYPPRAPTIECSENLLVRLGGVPAVSLKIKGTFPASLRSQGLGSHFLLESCQEFLPPPYFCCFLKLSVKP